MFRAASHATGKQRIMAMKVPQNAMSRVSSNGADHVGKERQVGEEAAHLPGKARDSAEAPPVRAVEEHVPGHGADGNGGRQVQSVTPGDQRARTQGIALPPCVQVHAIRARAHPVPP